ncbi:ATP-binding protein [Streptomyces globisporus]|uniref:ATP-binding protein n=1 Tax=Streptomyces globisporus TaxID=1908 RepID=UPI0038212DFE
MLEHRPEAASAARRFAKAVMDQWQVGLDPTEGIVLAVSELVTNAVEHANPPLALHLHREAQGGAIWVGVTDGGCTESEGAWTASRAADEHGRGLTIIDALAVAHGVHTHDNGTTTHWARLPA